MAKKVMIRLQQTAYDTLIEYVFGQSIEPSKLVATKFQLQAGVMTFSSPIPELEEKYIRSAVHHWHQSNRYQSCPPYYSIADNDLQDVSLDYIRATTAIADAAVGCKRMSIACGIHFISSNTIDQLMTLY